MHVRVKDIFMHDFKFKLAALLTIIVAARHEQSHDKKSRYVKVDHPLPVIMAAAPLQKFILN